VPDAQIAVVGASGTVRGAVSNAAGRFRIPDLVGAEVTLRVVRIGYRPLEQVARVGDLDVRLQLTETAVNLDRVVVTGTAGGEQRRSVGNSVAQIEASSVVATAPIRDVGQLLNARAPGVVVQVPNGSAGAGSRVIIRGAGSLNFDGNPLIYVDGVRVNNDAQTGPTQPGAAGNPSAASRLNDIDPADIESIEIVRGPAAATLYGTEASAGVIQIITKKGRNGPATFNALIRQGTAWIDDPAGRFPTNYTRDPATGEVSTFNAIRSEEGLGKEIFRTGYQQGYSLSVSGGTPAVRYYVSGGFDHDEGVDPMNTARQFNARTNLDFSPRRSLDLSANVSTTVGRTSFGDAGFMSGLLFARADLQDTPTRGFDDYPPEVLRATREFAQNVNRFTSSLQANHRVGEWLTQRLALGLDLTMEDNQSLYRRVPAEYEQFFSPTDRLGAKLVRESQSAYTTVDYSATARRSLFNPLTSSTSAGLQYYRRATGLRNLDGQQFPGSGVTTVGGAAIRFGFEDVIENTTVGMYVQQQFGWRERLFLTAAVRADDNSAFGSDFDVVTYPKFSASWVVNEESFWNAPFVNAFKLRAAYGQSGQQPAVFAAIRSYEPVAGAGDAPAGTPSFIGNPELGPERGEEYELGFEAGFFNDRAGIDFTYYDKRTEDAILARETAPSGGFPGAQFVNAGVVRNTGIELLARGRPVETERLGWDLSLNLSTNDNEVVSLGLPVDFLAVGFLPNRHQPGYPVGSFFVRKVVSAELDATGRAIDILCDGGPGSSGPVACADAPRLFRGSSIPRLEGAVTSSLTLFDRLSLGVLVDFKRGHRMYNSQAYQRCLLARVAEINVFPERFEPERVAECQLGGPHRWRYIEDASYAKLRELSLRYVLPERWAGLGFGARRATVSIGARNLHTWTKFTGLDPETFTVSNWLGSLHNEAVLPQPRVFMTTMNLTY